MYDQEFFQWTKRKGHKQRGRSPAIYSDHAVHLHDPLHYQVPRVGEEENASCRGDETVSQHGTTNPHEHGDKTTN
jgi:hypothetical protein